MKNQYIGIIVCEACESPKDFSLSSDSVGKRYAIKDTEIRSFKAPKGQQIITVMCQCGRKSKLWVKKAKWGID